MFVANGAVEKIRIRRKNAFYQMRLTELLTEARSLGISKDELIAQIMREEL